MKRFLKRLVPVPLLASLLLSIALPASLCAEDKDEVLLLTYFRDNGKPGVNLGMSVDGINFTALNDDKPIFIPPKWPKQDLTRDASIYYHEGLFHMVWTSGWTGRIFGYANSKDLKNWSEPRQITPFPASLPAEDQPDNVWAPEIHWDPAKKDFFILFSSTTPRERDNDNASNNDGKVRSKYDNRVFITRTKDFETFSPAKVFIDPGFASIDSVMRIDEASKRWVMVIKCSRNVNLSKNPGRNLWLTYTGLDLEHPDFTPLEGPIAGNYSGMFSNPDPQKQMAEGQSLLRYNDQWLLVWDEPAGDGFQLATSADLKNWTHRKDAKFAFQGKTFHGTLFLAPRSAVSSLLQK